MGHVTPTSQTGTTVEPSSPSLLINDDDGSFVAQICWVIVAWWRSRSLISGKEDSEVEMRKGKTNADADDNGDGCA